MSSAIGTIAEELIYNRIIQKIQFTQAQAGGRKGVCTADHVFIVRSIIAIAKKQKRNIIITFYDVVKAYDRADTDDIMYSISKSGVKGKLWRLTRAMNEGLTAHVNTKAGPTRQIQRETGGKQGGKLIVPLFAKMMDNLVEDMECNPDLGVQFSDVIIRALLYVDDAITIAEGYDQQELTLNEASEFAVKHKFSWGPKKCRTMEIGSHKEERSSWKLGDHEISKCDSYKYLGDYITRDGKNAENLKERGEKAKAVVRTIITCCKSEIMAKIGVTTMIRLHEAETIPTLLYNAETWTLTATEKKIARSG